MFRKLTDKIYVAPQIECADVGVAAAQGITLIINNRPEDESADQTSGADIEAAAKAAGLAYVAIPVTHAGFAEWQVTAMANALDAAEGKVLALEYDDADAVVTAIVPKKLEHLFQPFLHG